MYIKQCIKCDKDFKAREPNKKTAYKFCSQECYHSYNRTLPAVICHRCSKKFRQKESTQKFCSRDCIKIPLDLDRIIKLYQDGYSISYISKITGVSFGTVRLRLLSKNIKLRSDMASSFKGGRPFNYVNGQSKLRRAGITDRKADKSWRESVFKRDNYTCVKCKKTGCKLQADHIKRFTEFPNLRYEIDNGQTLCIHCHKIKTAEENRRFWINQYGSSKNYYDNKSTV